MSESGARVPRVLAIDAGGTMTDTFIVDGSGSFVVGKAQTTPEDESVGFMASARDALAQWDSTPEQGFPPIVSGIYSRHRDAQPAAPAPGPAVGCIVNAGHEDYLRLERGIQTYLGSSYSDRLHVATHFHNEPLVPRERMKGVRGRIDVFGRRGAAAARAGCVRGGGRTARRGRRGDRRLAALLLPQPRTRAAGRGDHRGGEGQARDRRRRPGVPLQRAVPDAPRPAATQLDGARGVRRRALALHAERRQGGDKGRRSAVRAARDGRARRNDLDRGQASSGEHWSRARSAESSAARRSRRGWTCATSCAPTSEEPRSTSR